MADPTPNIQLHRSELADNVSLAQDFNTNWDLIDAYVGAAKGSKDSIALRLAICLANSGGIQSGTSFPGSPVSFQLFFRTDTENLCIYSGSVWLNLAGLTATEATALKNLGTTTISAAQWGALGTFVAWTAWVPTLTGGADLSGYTTARYLRFAKICFFSFMADNKNVTSAGTIQITLPFTSAGGRSIPASTIHNGTAWIGSVITSIPVGTNRVDVAKDAANANWVGDETGVNIRLSGFFEIA